MDLSAFICRAVIAVVLICTAKSAYYSRFFILIGLVVAFMMAYEFKDHFDERLDALNKKLQAYEKTNL